MCVTTADQQPHFKNHSEKIPGAYSSGLSRTRFIDDLVNQTIGRGAKQLMILGAGFDTRALRLDLLSNIPVIEIDHPDTAALKINTLKKINDCLPANVRYLQIDFNKQSLTIGGVTKRITEKESDILNYLINNSNCIIKREAIY